MEILKEKRTNKVEVKSLFKEIPVKIPLEEGEFTTQEKVYYQKVYYDNKLVNKIPLRVIAVIPYKEVVEVEIQRKRDAVVESISIDKEKISVQLSLFHSGDFFIRFYKRSTEKVNLLPPDDFKGKIRTKNGDNI